MQLKRIGKAFAFGTVVAVVALVIAVRVYAAREKRRIDGELEEAFRTHSPAFFEDQRIASTVPLASGKLADAGAFLNPRLSWTGNQAAIDAWSKTLDPSIPKLALVKTTVERMAGWGQRWVDHADDAEIGALDLAWFDGLSSYDHWDVDEHGPAADPTRFSWYDKPIPSLYALSNHAKARLLQGLKSGDARAAAKAVRHVAVLMHSTETSFGAAMAGTLLELEHAAFDKQKASGGDVTGWTVVDADTRSRMRRQLFAYKAYASVYAPSDLAARAFEGKSSYGKCAAIEEGLVQALSVRWYLEASARARYDELQKLLATTEGECRLRTLRKAWSAWPSAYGVFTGSRDELCSTMRVDGSKTTPPICLPWIYAHVVPGGREDVGRVLASMALTGAFGAYANPAKP